MATLLKSFQNKKVLGNIRDVVKTLDKNGDKVAAIKVVGAIDGFRVTREGSNGETGIAFKAAPKVVAINLLSGEIFECGEMFFPDMLKGAILGAMESSSSPIEFGLQVSVIRNDESPVGYEYEYKELIERKESDPIAHLTALLVAPSNVAKLEAPKSAKNASK